MNDIGLYGSLYEQLRSYADRFDRGLIGIRSQSDATAATARDQLANILNEIADKSSTNPAARMIAIVLNQELTTTSSQGLALCAALSTALKARAPTAEELRELEAIATVLDHESSSTLARMRGQG